MPPGRAVRFMWSLPPPHALPLPQPGPVGSHICLQPARGRVGVRGVSKPPLLMVA